MADVKFGIQAEAKSHAKVIVKARDFNMIIDEPESLNGTNEGPNPVEYMLAAYAGCINVLGHIIAQEMGLELNGLHIDIEGNLNPDKLHGKSNEERAGFKEIRVTVYPDCEAEDEKLNAWLNTIEERCPVGDNLANMTPIKTRIKKR